MTKQYPVPPQGCTCASYWTLKQRHKADCPLADSKEPDGLEQLKDIVDDGTEVVEADTELENVTYSELVAMSRPQGAAESDEEMIKRVDEYHDWRMKQPDMQPPTEPKSIQNPPKSIQNEAKSIQSTEPTLTEAQLDEAWDKLTAGSDTAPTELIVPVEDVIRLEVIDWRKDAKTGRAFQAWGVAVKLDYQDSGRTLKVFVTDKESTHE
jgi:hypothetical protein